MFGSFGVPAGGGCCSFITSGCRVSGLKGSSLAFAARPCTGIADGAAPCEHDDHLRHREQCWVYINRTGIRC